MQRKTTLFLKWASFLIKMKHSEQLHALVRWGHYGELALAHHRKSKQLSLRDDL